MGFLAPDKQEKQESTEYLQVLAYRAAWVKCQTDQVGDCKTLLIHQIVGHLNGESPTPDGYIIDFTNSYTPKSDRFAYRVIVLNSGKVSSVERLDANALTSIPE